MRQQYHRRLVDGEAQIWDVHRLVELSRDLPALLVEVDAIETVVDVLEGSEGDGGEVFEVLLVVAF